MISFFPILSLLISAIFINKFFFTIMNNTVFIFSTSKLIALRILSSMTTSLISCRIATISFISFPIINPRSSIKNRLIIWGIFSSTLSNTPLIYIRKRIGDIKKPYEIIMFSNRQDWTFINQFITSWFKLSGWGVR